MKTILYVDALNLYYGCLKGTSYKWLDLQALFSKLLAENHDIAGIKYFTTRVRSTLPNKGARKRQNLYIRALKHYIPHLTEHYGHFLSHTVRMRSAENPQEKVPVIKTEEKGSDVNLAVHLLNDAWLDTYDCGIVVSNDSDMAESMKLVREHHPEKTLGLITPSEKWKTSEQLKQYALFTKRVWKSLLKRCQLPACIPNSAITKPKAWA